VLSTAASAPLTSSVALLKAESAIEAHIPASGLGLGQSLVFGKLAREKGR
jgi:hypothetical protein